MRKFVSGREAIKDILRENPQGMTVDQVYRALQEIGYHIERSTVHVSMCLIARAEKGYNCPCCGSKRVLYKPKRAMELA